MDLTKGVPAFEPSFVAEPGCGLEYRDGRMVAAVDIAVLPDGKSIVIHEWSSLFPSRGHSKQALKWLRSEGFTHITANGVGLIEDGVGDIATAYWQTMHELGLVDVLLDDEGVNITDVVTA
jgi:hypothetical protein